LYSIIYIIWLYKFNDKFATKINKIIISNTSILIFRNIYDILFI